MNSRKARRRLRARASELASEIIAGGIYERGPSDVERLSNPITLEALKSAFTKFFRGGGRPHAEILPTPVAETFPRNRKPAAAERCWLVVALDREGRVAYQTHWVSTIGDSRPDLEASALLAGPSFEAWRNVEGWGADFKTRGHA
jgi:hypothetical protein